MPPPPTTTTTTTKNEGSSQDVQPPTAAAAVAAANANGEASSSELQQESSAGGVQVAWLLERKDRLLRQLVEARPQQYVETVGRLQGYANRSLVVPGLFRIDPGQLECVLNLYGSERSVTCMGVANGDLVSASTEGLILIWDLNVGKPRLALREPAVHTPCRCITVTADGWLLASYDHGPINIWDVTTGRVVNRIVTDHTGVVEAMVAVDLCRASHVLALMRSSRARLLKSTTSPGREASGDRDEQERLAKESSSVEALQAAAEEARKHLLLQTGARLPVLVTASADTTLRVWDLETLDCIGVLRGHSARVTCLVVVGELIFSGSEDKSILCWDGNQTGFPNTKTWTGHEGAVNALIHAKVDLIISGSQDFTLAIWSISQSERLTALHGHSAPVNALARIDDDYFVSSATDQCIKIWSICELQCLQTFPCSAMSLLAVNNLIFTGGSSNLIKMWTSVTLVLNQSRYEGHGFGKADQAGEASQHVSEEQRSPQAN